MVSDSVGADVHAGRDLVVVQPLGHQGGDSLLGAGQAAPAGHRPVKACGPVAAAGTELAQPPPDAGLIPVSTGVSVQVEGFLQAADGLLPAALPVMQDTQVLCRRSPGPRVGLPGGGL